MRQIKFRAWDKKDKLWLTGWHIGQEGVASEYGNKVVMQFTGLHDRNEKEIYEGDVVKYKYDSLNECVTEIKYENTTGLYRLGCEVSEKSAINHILGLSESYHTVEIIGNIYENPDLLK